MYQIKLSGAELETLNWAAARGYFPEAILYEWLISEEDSLRVENCENLYGKYSKEVKDLEVTYLIPGSLAFEFILHREKDPNSLFSCIGGNLLEKLLKLESEIV